MNGQLLTALATLALAAMLLPATQAVQVQEAREQLSEPIVHKWVERCFQDKGGLSVENILEGYVKIFRLVYDSPVLLERAVGNWQKFNQGMKHNDEPRELVRHHSAFICKSIDSFLEVYGEKGYNFDRKDRYDMWF